MATTSFFYNGLIRTVHAVAIADHRSCEDSVFARVVGETGGTARELGSGARRRLLRLQSAGHQVYVLEISEQMTEICLAEATRLGLRTVIDHGSSAPLDPALCGHAPMFCPLDAISFIVDDELALEAVQSFVARLDPGGVLAIAGSFSDSDPRTWDWVRRPDVPIASTGVTQVGERRAVEADGRCPNDERAITVVAPDGRMSAREDGIQLRRLRSISEIFAESEVTNLPCYGSDADYAFTGWKG